MNTNYSDSFLKNILQEVKTIAIVGASPNPDRDSYKVMKFLIDYEYQIYPVNPNETNILGRKCYPDLESIQEKIDMVDVFRAEKFILDILVFSKALFAIVVT